MALIASPRRTRTFSRVREAAGRFRERMAGLPRAMWACAAVAIVNAAAWAMITPTFQVPDEPVHVGYTQYVAETGKVPRVLGPYFLPSAELSRAVNGVPFSVLGSPTWSAESDRLLDRDLEEPLPRESESGAGYASANPPLYYMTMALAYRAGSDRPLLDRILFMRLLSALLAGATVVFVFLFLRELLPGSPRVWPVGALVVALNPLFAFIGGGINPDVLLCLFATVAFWLLARGFRRGLTPRLGLALGLVVAGGILTKTAMFGLVPGIAVGVAALLWRSWHHDRRPAVTGAGLAALGAGLPAAGWIAANTFLYERAATTTTASFQVESSMSLNGFISYTWQFFFPRLPWMQDWLGQLYPIWDTYFQGLVGRFGWFEWGFPEAVSVVALVLFVGLVALALSGLWRARDRVRARAGELLTYLAIAVGLMLLIELFAYRYLIETNFTFEQARYLLPLVSLYAALVAVAVRSAGRRWGPLLGALLVVVAVGHNLFAQLLSLARYYT
jgi:4-amino-4-deoxy-L-arabinose transferase-like glycosyltransferase